MFTLGQIHYDCGQTCTTEMSGSSFPLQIYKVIERVETRDQRRYSEHHTVMPENLSIRLALQHNSELSTHHLFADRDFLIIKCETLVSIKIVRKMFLPNYSLQLHNSFELQNQYSAFNSSSLGPALIFLQDKCISCLCVPKG